jgi:RNA polymerase sigma factor (sigma-70 family)
MPTGFPRRPRTVHSRRRPPAPAHATDHGVGTIVVAARAGDAAAWTELIERYEGMLRAIARSYRLAPADVDDAVQSTWLQLITSIDRVREPAAVAGWLATTARRECLRRAQAPIHDELPEDAEVGDRAGADGPEAGLLAAERSAILARALASLPTRQRELMTFLVTEPAPPYESISATLAMPVGSIGPIRARTLARLSRHPELRALFAA